jgi:hypothetical protein
MPIHITEYLTAMSATTDIGLAKIPASDVTKNKVHPAMNYFYPEGGLSQDWTAPSDWIKYVRVVGRIIPLGRKDLAMKPQRRFSREFKRQVVEELLNRVSPRHRLCSATRFLPDWIECDWNKQGSSEACRSPEISCARWIRL